MVREYKDSGIEWIGRIPKDWKVCKLNYIYRFQTGATPPTNVESYFNGDIKWANISDLGARTIFDTNKKLSNSGVDKCCMSISPKGSLMYSFKLSVGLVSFCGDDMYTNEAIATFLEGYGYLPYLYYMAPIAIIHNANFNIYGAPILNQELIKGAKIIVPPLAEQRAIASYLDRKCAEIDSLVELQEQMIAQLTDYKQSVITGAVTKGLNPEAELVPSGIDWIGDVPKGWAITKVKWQLNERKERSERGKEEPLSMSQKYGLIPTKEMDVVPNMASSFVGAKLVYKGDLVFNKLKAHLGVFAVSKFDGLVSPDYAVYSKRGNCSMKYLEYLFKTPQYIAEFRKLSTGVGAGLTRLYTDDLFSISCIYPPANEQESIALYIQEKCHEIDTLISIKRQKIETLKDYKKSIIFEAVTGKTNID